MSFLETWNFFHNSGNFAALSSYSAVLSHWQASWKLCNNFWTVSFAFYCVSIGTCIKSGNMDITSLADKCAARLFLLNTPVFWSRTFSSSCVHLWLAFTGEAASQALVPRLCLQMLKQQEAVSWEWETLSAWQADMLWVFWWGDEAASSLTIQNSLHLFSDLKLRLRYQQC